MGATGSIGYTIGKPMPGSKWVVRGKLGQGGMGLVLDVVKARLIPGAMKVLLPSIANVPEFAEKFLEEVKVTARLQHPNVVQVLDFDRLEDGTPFMVMERLRGRTLRAALRETQQRGKSWTPANAYAVAAQIAQGLYRAHSHDPAIVHRDVKPENVYLHRAEGSFESIVKVMDFGVAAVVGERDRQRIGTPRYMAPEQVQGDPVSPQTDQYALGLVVYEMLTGRFPWDVNLRDVSALADVHRHVPPPPPSRFCPWLPARAEAAILKALAKDPAARHDTVHGLVFELRGLQSIDDPSSTVTGDAHSTEPMVGTLADGGAVVREEHDTFERMPAPSVNGPSLVVPDADWLGETGDELSERWPPPVEAPASPSETAGPKESPDLARVGSRPTGRAPGEPGARAGEPDERSTAALAPLDTPMTGEAEPALEDPVRGKAPLRTVRVAALSLAGAGAIVGILLSARTGGPHRSPVQPANPLESAASASASDRSDARTEPAHPLPSPIDTTVAAAEPSAPPLPVSTPDRHLEAMPGGVRPDPRPGRGVMRSVIPIASAPTPRAAPTKPSPPDDGRDELYIPESR